MTWHAKPSGAYSLTSQEGIDNIYEMAASMHAATLEAQAAAIGNSYHEGGLNPWRWQYDRQSSVPDLGYGLFQFSPGSGYTSLSWARPNMSVTSVTSGALPEDGATQVEMMSTNYLNKWKSDCWRSYWSQTTYSELYAYRQRVLDEWGDGSNITISQWSDITDIDAATFVFLACFEGPRIPNFDVRKSTAKQVYEILGGSPIPPTPPQPPIPPVGVGIPFWIMKAIRDKAFKRP